MTKAEFVSKVQTEAKLATKAEAERAVNAVLTTIRETVKEGDKVAFVGFGTFSKAHRAERTGKNPQTHEAITIPARDVAHFKASKSFLD